jgi:hypothetical protein
VLAAANHLLLQESKRQSTCTKKHSTLQCQPHRRTRLLKGGFNEDTSRQKRFATQLQHGLLCTMVCFASCGGAVGSRMIDGNASICCAAAIARLLQCTAVYAAIVVTVRCLLYHQAASLGAVALHGQVCRCRPCMCASTDLPLLHCARSCT